MIKTCTANYSHRQQRALWLRAMGKDRRKEIKEEDESLGKKQDKWGKAGDGKKDANAADKSFTHQTVRHILVQKMSDATRILSLIHI